MQVQHRDQEPGEQSGELMGVPTPVLLASCVQRSISKPTKEVLTFPFLAFLQLSLILFSATLVLSAQQGGGLLRWSFVVFSAVPGSPGFLLETHSTFADRELVGFSSQPEIAEGPPRNHSRSRRNYIPSELLEVPERSELSEKRILTAL